MRNTPDSTVLPPSGHGCYVGVPSLAIAVLKGARPAGQGSVSGERSLDAPKCSCIIEAGATAYERQYGERFGPKNVPIYTCLCCGHTEAFETAQDAFEASWDVAPYFTLQPLCNLCLSAPVMILGLDGARRLHAKAHEEWKEHGRPPLIRAVTNETPNQDQN